MTSSKGLGQCERNAGRIYTPGPDTFKGHLDKWLRTIPDIPKIDNYRSSVPAKSNGIYNQAKQAGQIGDSKCG